MHQAPSAKPSVTIFGSAQKVTCAVMDYSQRLSDAINTLRPGFAAVQTIEPDNPVAFVGAIVEVLRRGSIVHFQLPIEGWGNRLLPGSALMAARTATRMGRIIVTLHEWTSLNRLRYLSMIPDILASDGFIFVSPKQRAAFLATPLVSQEKKRASPVIPIGPNILPSRIDPDRVAKERMTIRGEGANEAELVIGYFGVLYASKRPDMLLRVIRALQDRGVKARLLICGDFLWDKPKHREDFFALAKELKVAEWLDFRGRIDAEDELMATLAAADVFLLPFTDGVSTRRGSFQAVSQLAIPLVTTFPEEKGEFDLSPSLKTKIESPATVLCSTDATPETFANAVMTAIAHKAEAVGVALTGLWDEAAIAHLAFYDTFAAPDGQQSAA